MHNIKVLARPLEKRPTTSSLCMVLDEWLTALHQNKRTKRITMPTQPKTIPTAKPLLKE